MALTLTADQVAAIRQAQRILSEQVVNVQKLEKCGANCEQDKANIEKNFNLLQALMDNFSMPGQ